MAIGASEKLGLLVAIEGFRQFMSQMGQMDKQIGGTGKAWTGLNKFAGQALGALGNVAKFGLAVVGSAALAAVGGVAALGVELAKLTLAAAPLEGIGIAFDVMSTRAGLSLDELRIASKGTIADFELMRISNVALTGAGKELGQEFGQHLPDLMRIAQASAKATGLSADYMFNSLVTGIKRTSPMLIDNTGLQLKLGESNQALADSLGITVEELTAEQKQIALLNATLEAGQVMVDDFGGGSLTAAENLAQMKASVQNLKDQIGVAFLPVLKAVLEPLNQLAQFVGPILVDWADRFSGALMGLTGMFDQMMEIEAFNEVLGQLSEWWETHGPAITAAAQEMFGLISEQLSALVTGELIPFLVEQLEKFSAWFDENGDLIAQAFIDLATIHIPNLVSSIIEMWQIVEPILSGLVDVFLLTVELIAQIIEGDWDAAWRTAVGILAEVIEAMRLALDGFFNWIATEIMGTTLEQIRQQWQDNWDMAAIILQTWVNDTLVALAEFAGQWINNFDEMWAQLGNKLADFVNDALMAIVNWIMELLQKLREGDTKVQQVMADLVNNALMKLAAGIGRARGIGSDIVNGLIEGVKSKAAALASAARQVVSDALAAARNALGANSPSREFMSLGRDMMAGLSIGMESLTPAIERQISAIVSPGKTAGGRVTNYVDNSQTSYNLSPQSVMRDGGLAAEFDAMAFMGAK